MSIYVSLDHFGSTAANRRIWLPLQAQIAEPHGGRISCRASSGDAQAKCKLLKSSRCRHDTDLSYPFKSQNSTWNQATILPGLIYFGRSCLFQVCFRYSCRFRSSWPFTWLESLGFKWFQGNQDKQSPASLENSCCIAFFHLKGKTIDQTKLGDGDKTSLITCFASLLYVIKALLYMEVSMCKQGLLCSWTLQEAHLWVVT